MSFADPSQCQLTVEAAVGGTSNPPPGVYTYNYGVNMTITAIPDSGFIFDWWTDGSGHFMSGANTMTWTMYSNMTLQPVFENVSTAQRVLTIDAAANGTTNPSPGNYTYAYDSNVTVNAIPDPGYILDYWTNGNGNFMGGGTSFTVMMNYNTTLQPVFEYAASAMRTLTILGGSNGATDPPAGNYTYAYGYNVTVTAIPDSGYIFAQWQDSFGNFMGTQNPNMIILTWNCTIQPVFENASTAQATLTINSAVGGTTDPPPGNYTYAYGTSVNVTAIPDTGYVFDHWMMGGGGFGNQNPLQFVTNWNATLQPVFENATSGQRTLTIGIVSNGTTDPPPGTYTYDYGANVTVTAIPQNGFYFGGWFLDQASGGMSNPITITMDTSHMLAANFVPNIPTLVEVTISPATGGTTDPPPGNYSYPAGNQAKVTAIPDSGWWLSQWLIDGNRAGNSTTIEFPLNGNHTVTPMFASNSQAGSFMLTINAADGGTTNPAPGTQTFDYGTNVTITASPNSGESFDHWLLDGETVNQNPITVVMTQDHTLQPVFTSNSGNSGNSGKNGFSLKVPPVLVLILGMVVIAGCLVGYLVPLGLGIRSGKIPSSVKMPRLILALVSILVIVGPLGATLIAYSGDLSGVLAPSNVNKLTNLLSNQSGLQMPNVTSSWCNVTSRTFCLQFNFTNPTPTDLTIISLSANMTDHSDGYPLGPISLPNAVTASADQTVTFQMTGTLSEEAATHVATAHAGENTFDVDLSNVNINYAGLMLQLNMTSTINNVEILR